MTVRHLPRLPRPRPTTLAALALGFASATGFAPLDWWPVTLAALPLLMALIARQQRLAPALTIGWAFGWAHFTLGLNWIQKSFTYQDQMPHWLGYLAPALLAVYLAVFPAAAAGLAWRYGRQDRRVFVLVFAAAWIVVELLRARLFTGFPWNPLGAIFVPWLEMARASRLLGTYGLSGIAVLASGALWLAVDARTRRAAGGIVAALAVLALTGLHRPAPLPAPAAAVRIVQPNIDQRLVQDVDRREDVLRIYERLSSRPRGPLPTLILWPEGAIRYLIEPGYPPYLYMDGEPWDVLGRLAAVAGPRDLLVTGSDSLVIGGGQVIAAHNAMFVIDGQGRFRGRYDKAHLVPWGEYLPARSVLEPLGLSRVVPGAIDFLPGPGPRTLPLPAPFGGFGVQTCYEIVFSGEVVDPASRPRLLFNPSNDSWFGTWGPPQHLAQARLRAIEEGIPVLRSTPTGISALIAGDGRLLASLPVGAAGVIDAAMPAALPPTPFARFGNLLAWGFAGLLALIAIALRRRRR